MWSRRVSGVQPSERCDRAKRTGLAHQEDLVAANGEDLAVDFARVVTGKEHRSGAILSGVSILQTLQRAPPDPACSGIEPTIRLQAKGEMQLERTLKSRHVESEGLGQPDDAHLRGRVVGLARIAHQP